MNKHEQKPSEDEQKLSEDKTTRTPIYTLTIVSDLRSYDYGINGRVLTPLLFIINELADSKDSF